MQEIKAPFVESLTKDSFMHDVSEQLDKLDKSLIAVTPWPDYSYKPNVEFIVAHNHDCLFIKFYVQENSVRAVFRRDNEPVYKDSCVEFFISFNYQESYYNLEFNSLGTCRFGYGPNQQDRTMLPESETKKIKRSASLTIVPVPGKKSLVKWELTLLIPISAFIFHDFESIKDQVCRVNFYKCGDDLPNPHYVTWNQVEADEPNFHLPEFFGNMQLL